MMVQTIAPLLAPADPDVELEAATRRAARGARKDDPARDISGARNQFHHRRKRRPRQARAGGAGHRRSVGSPLGGRGRNEPEGPRDGRRRGGGEPPRKGALGTW